MKSSLYVDLPRPLKVILYAALVGLLFASYISPLQGIIESKSRIAELETTEGVERAARERYGMIKPGEKVYLVPED